MAFLRRLRRAIPGGRLLDVGCGEGRHAIAAAKLGFRVVAIDYEPLALRRARRFAKAGNVRGVAFRLADILRAAFADLSEEQIEAGVAEVVARARQQGASQSSPAA